MKIASSLIRLARLPWLPFVLVLGLFLFSGPFDGLAFGQEEGAEQQQEANIVWHIITSAGPVFGPILLIVSVCLAALCVMLFMDLRTSQAVPDGFVDEFTDIVNKRRFKEAFEMAREDPSMLGRVLTAGMSRLQYGLDDAREAAHNMLDSLRSDKDQKNNYTAVIGSLGPMIGLVGTVFGMILAFKELSYGASAETGRLAEGISHALVITLLGIGIALPAIFFNALFRNRITRVGMNVSHIADDLLTQMYHNSKRPGAPGGAAAPAPAAAGPPGGGAAPAGPPPRG